MSNNDIKELTPEEIDSIIFAALSGVTKDALKEFVHSYFQKLAESGKLPMRDASRWKELEDCFLQAIDKIEIRPLPKTTSNSAPLFQQEYVKYCESVAWPTNR
jgi:hypothetical protein